MILLEVAKTLDKAKVNYAVVGGYALALQGVVRATVDVDIVITLNEQQLAAAQSALESIGLQSRLPLRAKEIAKFRKEYIKERNLLAWSFVDFKDPSRVVDILLNEDIKRLTIKRISVANVKIRVASLEDIKKMKLRSGRKQDLADIESIERLLNDEKEKNS